MKAVTVLKHLPPKLNIPLSILSHLQQSVIPNLIMLQSVYFLSVNFSLIKDVHEENCTWKYMSFFTRWGEM